MQNTQHNDNLTIASPDVAVCSACGGEVEGLLGTLAEMIDR